MPPLPAGAGGQGGPADPASSNPQNESVVPPSVRRLTKRWQFLACAKGRSLARGAVAIQVLNRSDGSRWIGIGFTATKKVGGAVVRNRAKRRLREAARVMLPLHGSPSHDYVFVARIGTPQRDWSRLLDDVKSALVGLAAGGGDVRPPRPSARPSAKRTQSQRPQSPRPKAADRPQA